MSTIGAADHNISAQIGYKQQLLGARGSFLHGLSWFLQIFPRMLHFHGFTGFSWIFMVFIVFMDFHGFPRFGDCEKCF